MREEREREREHSGTSLTAVVYSGGDAIWYTVGGVEVCGSRLVEVVRGASPDLS